MSLELKLALTGNYEAMIKTRRSAVLRGLKKAVEAETLEVKNALRRDVRRAGMGRKLAFTWRGEVYPNGKRLSWSPAGFIYS